VQVESITKIGEGFSGVIVAEVKAKAPHPKAEKLTLVQVWDGTATFDVVCGASNVPAPGGKVLPETEEVLKIIARENLSLATGHIAPEESLAVIKRAKELGVKNIVVTHAMAEVPGMTLAQVKQAVAMGAFIEYCFLNDIHGPQSYWPFLRSWKRVSFADIAKVIKEVGAQHFILSSDLGQNGTPMHPDGMEMMINGMKREGLSQADVDLMVKKNPARFLGLES